MSKIARIIVTLALLAAPGFLPASADEPIALRLGDEVFWDGPFIERAGFSRQSSYPTIPHQLCGTPVLECYQYAIEVLEPAARLRVALDHPRLQDWGLALLDPNGDVADEEELPRFSSEVFAPNPATGTWTAVVKARNVTRSAFRMRASLEKAQKLPNKRRLLVPNLRITPPFTLAWGCQDTETRQEGAVRCLRFATGPENIGDGPLELRVQEPGLTGRMTQRIYRTDGSFVDRPAGTYEYHQEHLHYHHRTVGELELYRVLEPKQGEMEKVGKGPKMGFCMADSLIAEWDSFTQDPPRQLKESLGYCLSVVATPAGTSMGLTRGWGDIYPQGTEGNYVDFGTNPDGEYVVRVTSDPDSMIMETDEGDNVAYALVRIENGVITVLERGYGLSPWDHQKRIATDTRAPLA